MPRPSDYQDHLGRTVPGPKRAGKATVVSDPREQDSQEVISLWEAAKRIGLHSRGSGRPSNWTPFLAAICKRGFIDVRRDDSKVPRIRSTDLEYIALLVQRHFERPRLYPTKGEREPRHAVDSMRKPR